MLLLIIIEKVRSNPLNYTLPEWLLYSTAEDHIVGIPEGLVTAAEVANVTVAVLESISRKQR